MEWRFWCTAPHDAHEWCAARVGAIGPQVTAMKKGVPEHPFVWLDPFATAYLIVNSG